MSKPMDFTEFAKVINHVKDNNSPFKARVFPKPVVKYIDPVFDMRSNQVFSITFRGFGGGDYNFHCQNEKRALNETLYERCMEFLMTGKHE